MNHRLLSVLFAFMSFFFIDGRKEPVLFDKITSRISKLCYGLNQDFIDPVRREH